MQKLKTPCQHNTTASGLTFRSARSEDGAGLWQLVKSAGTLELNSAYFYLLFATDFGDTCLLAEEDGNLIGAVIGYRPPREQDCAFVWQIGVSADKQGRGLGQTLLEKWITLPGNLGVQWITATVAEDNRASRHLFQAFARKRGVNCSVSDHFIAAHFPHEHPPEQLFRIGPLV